MKLQITNMKVHLAVIELNCVAVSSSRCSFKTLVPATDATYRSHESHNGQRFVFRHSKDFRKEYRFWRFDAHLYWVVVISKISPGFSWFNHEQTEYYRAKQAKKRPWMATDRHRPVAKDRGTWHTIETNFRQA